MKKFFLLLAVVFFTGSVFASDVTDTKVDFRRIVQSAKDKVFPAVVYIKCLRDGFESGKKESQEVTGSGVLISADGEVLTNWHVIDKASEVRCLLYDGRAAEAKVLGSDKDTDLALLKLKLKNGTKLPFATFGDSDKLREGDFVMAMGAPWGLSRSVSIGIISCTNRYLEGTGGYTLWLQTDAAISPGNSGGPLVDTDGEIVGINTRGALFGGDLGFSIPSNMIKILVPRLREFGKVNWSWFGLQLQPLHDFNKNIYFKGDSGIIVSETDPSSPARQAGIKSRDRIVAVNSIPVTVLTHEQLPLFKRMLGILEKNKPVKFTLLRNGKTVNLEVTPQEKGAVEGKEFDCKRWDMTVKMINRFDNPDLYFYRPEGVFLFGIKYEGNARDAGLRRNDIILKIGSQKIKTLEDVKKVHTESLENIDENPRLVLSVLRNGMLRQIVMDISRDYEKE